jgi:hypothetical protein
MNFSKMFLGVLASFVFSSGSIVAQSRLEPVTYPAREGCNRLSQNYDIRLLCYLKIVRLQGTKADLVSARLANAGNVSELDKFLLEREFVEFQILISLEAAWREILIGRAPGTALVALGVVIANEMSLEGMTLLKTDADRLSEDFGVEIDWNRKTVVAVMGWPRPVENHYSR